MKALADLCKPRQSVFDLQRRDVVLDITDLIDERIEAKKFFEENFSTDGMKRLLREAFRRFAGKSDQGVFVLTPAMGGGKTHNMIALGLLAREPSLRKQVMAELYEAGDSLGKVRVVGFTGHETDAPLGIWGSIAEQLGKKDQFKDYYSPLQPPGQTAWVKLLKGEPIEESKTATGALRHGIELPGKLFGLHEVQGRGNELALVGRESVDDTDYYVLRLTFSNGVNTTL